MDWRAEVVTLRRTKAGVTQHVPLSVSALAILRDLGPGDGEAPIFTRPDGGAVSGMYVSHAFGRAVTAAGVKDLHVHDLRHGFACRLLRNGVGIYAVSKLLRHDSVVMSERYAHQSQADLKAAVNKATATPTATGKEAAS